jgi:hypothetical protein
MKLPVTQPIITQKEKNKIERYIALVKKEGYRPFVTVRQSHTIGQGQIIYSHETNRTHHFLSRGELVPFFHFEANKIVEDIFDQYPLPIEDTLKLAVDLNIVHPGSYQEAEDFDGYKPAKTMTLDYVVKHQDKSLHAYNFKYADALNPKLTSPQSVARTEAKAKIEREYCKKNKISWTQLTEFSFHSNVTNNLRYLREYKEYEKEFNVSDEFKVIALTSFRIYFEKHPEMTVYRIIEMVANDLGIALFQGQFLFQMLAYNRVISFDWLELIDLNRPLPLVGELRYVS